MRLDVVKPFDPWRSPLCTCPPKMVTSPYTGCGHRCLYCYATSYIPRHYDPRPKNEYIARLRRDLLKIPPGTLIEMATSSDPYTPPEKELGLTRRAIEIILSKGMRLLITTKSSLVVRDVDILAKYRGRVAVAITITTIRRDIAAKIEPFAPPPEERIKAVEILSSYGIPVTVRIDPLIPEVNTDPKDLEKLIDRVAEAGAVQITSSTYKAKPDNLARMKRAFPELAKLFDELYRYGGERIHGYMYLDRRIRLELLKTVKELAEERGLVFETCREGFPYLGTPGFSCDGSSYTHEDVYNTISTYIRRA